MESTHSLPSSQMCSCRTPWLLQLLHLCSPCFCHLEFPLLPPSSSSDLSPFFSEDRSPGLPQYSLQSCPPGTDLCVFSYHCTQIISSPHLGKFLECKPATKPYVIVRLSLCFMVTRCDMVWGGNCYIVQITGLTVRSSIHTS